MTRKYFNHSIEQLEKEFEKSKSDPKTLAQLNEELRYRNTQRAKNLTAKIKPLLSKAAQPISQPAAPEPIPLVTTEKINSIAPRTHDPDQPRHILSAWSALEVLSPQTFRKPQDLARESDPRLVASFAKGLPWENGGERSRENKKLFYQVILGTIDMEAATSRLLQTYSDKRDERPQTRGEALLAIAVVDKSGRLTGNSPIAVSSFGWGVPIALKGDLDKLADWAKAEQSLLSGLDKILRVKDPAEKDLPITSASLHTAYHFLVSQMGLPAELVQPKQFAIRVFDWYKNPEPPEPQLLSSFFLNDLAKAAKLFAEKKVPGNLRRYLGAGIPQIKTDLHNDLIALEKVVAPALIPPARWPAGSASLVTLQQAAVNIALSELKDGGIVAVNGPPGTGKTTLLRDLIAGIICQRAEALCSYDDPESAFSHSGEKIAAGSAWLHLYKVDPKIKGYEILIASSNNKAVENVSAELPGIGAIAGEQSNLRYLKPLSDTLLERETWGLIAAVLGNATNRAKFIRTFWWDEEVSLRPYLAEAAGTPQFINVTDPQTNEVTGTRKPSMIAAEQSPDSHIAAVNEWRTAKNKFIEVLRASRAEIKQLEQLRELIQLLPRLVQKEKDALDTLDGTQKAADHIRQSISSVQPAADQLHSRLTEIAGYLKDHLVIRPNWFRMLFNLGTAPAWKKDHQNLKERQKQVMIQLHDESSRLARLQSQLLDANDKIRENQTMYDSAGQRRKDAGDKIETAREKLKGNLLDESFFILNHAGRHQLSPWQDAYLHQLRDAVFAEAIHLHQAFLNAAAKPLRHNLGVLMMNFSGKPMPDQAKQALLPELWSSLFLVIPALSTTFASVERMLGQLPPESLGWLLIDEAGQALPQAAVGAILRTKRAVVVGDPVQIEPIVALPETLTKAICRHFAANPDKFNAPEASVQTLADTASAYFAEFETQHGSRSVGIPLLVHRRCAAPMFHISNDIAYARLMVHAKATHVSPIKNVLGSSRWIDMKSTAQDKWSMAEGHAALELLSRLKKENTAPDVYLITPFVAVADGLRKLISDSRLLDGWVADPYSWVYERIGTVHTVQGREAEAVIFVLGAPLPEQAGARTWAGSRPNLLNVAVTRAKETLYVIGNKELWGQAGVFRNLAQRV